MNKLVVTFTNWDENRIYAVEIRGNNNKINPAYERDLVDDHFVVDELVLPFWRPAISGGSTKGQMLIAYNERVSQTNFNIWGRLVHVWEGGSEIYLPLIMR